MKIIFFQTFILLTILFSSCSNEEVLDLSMGLNHVMLQIKDAEGVDLLNPNTPNYIDLSTSKLYQMSNGSERSIESFLKSQQPQPGMTLFANKEKNYYAIKLIPYYWPLEENPTKNIIYWSDGSSDVIECEWTFWDKGKNQYPTIIQIRINEEQVMNVSADQWKTAHNEFVIIH